MMKMPVFRPKRTYRKRRTLKPRRRLGRRAGFRRPLRSLATGSNMSSIHEEFDFNVTAGTTFAFTQAIGDLVRGKSIAPFFQEYKIAQLKLIVKPKWDMYPVDLTSAQAQLPYLYYISDPANSVANTIAYADYIAMGCKPTRLERKNIVRYVSPSVIMNSPTSSTVSLPALIKKSPWLPTSSTMGGAFTLNNVIHHGAKFLITPVNTSDTSNYVVTCSVKVLFRKPMIQEVTH